MKVNLRSRGTPVARMNWRPGLNGATGATGPFGPAIPYATVAAASAATITGSASAVLIAGYASAGDGGAARYVRVGSQPSHAGKFQSLDGAWWELAEFVITPEMFGAKADLLTNLSNVSTATDNTTPFANLAAFVNAKGGAVINFRPGSGYYKVWPNGGSLTSQVLFYFTNAAVVAHFNGAKFYTDNSWPGLGNNQVFFFQSCPVIEVRNPQWVQGTRTLNPNGYQPTMFFVNDDCPSVTVTGVNMLGGGACMICRPGGDTNVQLAPRPRNIVLTGYTEDVYYGWNGSARNVKVDLICKNTGRSYFPISPCFEHHININSTHGGPFDDLLIEVLSNNQLQYEENGMKNIFINYTSASRMPGTVGTTICNIRFSPLNLGTGSPTAPAPNGTPAGGYLVNFHLNVAMGQGADGQSPILNIDKILNGVGDTVARNNILSNVTVGGSLTGIQPVAGDARTTLLNFTNTGSWAGESVSNVGVRGLDCPATTKNIVVDQSKLPGTLLLQDITGAGTNINITSEDRSRISETGVRAANRTTETAWAAYTSTIGPGSGSITSITQSCQWRQNKDKVQVLIDFTITNNGTGASYIAVSLPAAIKAPGGWPGAEVALTGDPLTLYVTTAGSTTAFIRKPDGSYPGGTGRRLAFAFEYPV